MILYLYKVVKTKAKVILWQILPLREDGWMFLQPSTGSGPCCSRMTVSRGASILRSSFLSCKLCISSGRKITLSSCPARSYWEAPFEKSRGPPSSPPGLCSPLKASDYDRDLHLPPSDRRWLWEIGDHICQNPQNYVTQWVRFSVNHGL